MADVMRWALVGVVVGVAGALSLTSITASLVYEVAPTDALVLAGAACVLVGICGTAACVSARRSLSLDLSVLMGMNRFVVKR